MMRPLCVYDPEVLDTLNNCCPDEMVYNATKWALDEELECYSPDPCYGKREKKCNKDPVCTWDPLAFTCYDYNEVPPEGGLRDCEQLSKRECKKVDATCKWSGQDGCIPKPPALASALDAAEDPMEQQSASSDRAGLKVSAMLAGLFLLLWN